MNTPSNPAEVPHHPDLTPHGTRTSYLVGFALSVVLTAIPFWLVMGGAMTGMSLLPLVLAGFAAVQMVVHMIYFLHMSARSEEGWTLMALIFTLMLVVIAMSGTLWVLYHLDANMMPMSPAEMRNMP